MLNTTKHLTQKPTLILAKLTRHIQAGAIIAWHNQDVVRKPSGMRSALGRMKIMSVDDPSKITLTCALEVQALYKIVNLIGAAVHLDTTLASILQVLHHALRMERATLTLLDETGQHLVIRASYGLSVEEEQRGVYGLSEGIYGQVFSTASPVVVPIFTVNRCFSTVPAPEPKFPKPRFP